MVRRARFKRNSKNDIIFLFISTFIAAALLTRTLSLAFEVETQLQDPQPEAATIEVQCEQNAICYELVETVAEYTDYTEQEIVDFFVIVSDDIDAWTAIRLLDSSLTEGQINAILEISAMKQAK